METAMMVFLQERARSRARAKTKAAVAEEEEVAEDAAEDGKAG